jgi:hypothetical protein
MNFSHGEEPNKNKDQSKDSRKGNIPPEYLGNVLRAEILPADELTPDKPGLGEVLQRINFRYVAFLVVVIVLIGSGLVCLIGPGKPILEDSLVSLKNKDIPETPSGTPKKVPGVAGITQAFPTATATWTKTPTIVSPSKTVAHMPTSTPTEADGCADPLDINLDDVGKTMCVRGIITGMEERDVGFIVYFSDERGIFYLVTYDFVWDQAEPGDCIQITGEIQQLSNTPVLVFGWNNIPEFCP